MADALQNKAIDIVFANLCETARGLNRLKNALASNHPAILKESEQWRQTCCDFIDEALKANTEAFEWTEAMRADRKA